MHSTAVNPLGVYDSSTALWLQGKGQQVQTEQENPDKKSEPSAVLMTGRTEEFNRQLREKPSDTQLWIKFIKFQVKRLTFYVMHYTGTLQLSLAPFPLAKKPHVNLCTTNLRMV